MPRRAILLIMALLLAASGCVSHVARIRLAPEPAAGSAPPPALPPRSAAIGSRISAVQPALSEERGGQPREIPISTWRRDDEGNIQRGEAVLRTPTPWWQRFPADVISDVLWPGTVVAEASLVVTPVAVPASDPTALAERARRAGYAAP